MVLPDADPVLVEKLPGGLDTHHAKQLLRWGNPITPADRGAPRAALRGHPPAIWDVVYLVVAAAVALALGAWVFSRVDDRIAVEL